MLRRSVLTLVVAMAFVMAGTLSVRAADRFIMVASTTSTENSGLFHYLLPLFQHDTGIEARVAAFRIEGEQAFFPNARKSGS